MATTSESLFPPAPRAKFDVGLLARQMGRLMESELPTEGYVSVSATWINEKGLMLTATLTRTNPEDATDDDD